MTEPLEAVTEAVRPWLLGADEADVENCATAVLAAIQGLYVPPPPGSDRDALPEHLRGLIAPHMRPYISTACETALALDRAAQTHLPSMTTLVDWERRQHAACRITRKQDMAECVCDCHPTTPTTPERIAGTTTGRPPDLP
jgi:hypothetical protein